MQEQARSVRERRRGGEPPHTLSLQDGINSPGHEFYKTLDVLWKNAVHFHPILYVSFETHPCMEVILFNNNK